MIQAMLTILPSFNTGGENTGVIQVPIELSVESYQAGAVLQAAVMSQGLLRALLPLVSLAIQGQAEKAPEERLLRQLQSPHLQVIQ